jgi:pentatricopeptide repeat protein
LWFPISQFSSPFWRAAILEYQAPAWSTNRLFYLTLAASALLQMIGWRRLRPKLFFPSLLFGYLACTSQRSMLFFVIAAMPHLALLLKELTASIDFKFPRVRLALPIAWLAIVLLMFLQNPVFVFGSGFYHPYYPLEVYNFIRAEVPPQNLFNEMRYGGSMLWWLYPQFKPFIDGRGDAFSEQFWKSEYLPVISSRPGSREILEKYNVTGALLPIYEDRTLPPLAKTLHADKDWALVAFNDNTLLFLRRTAANQEVIARHAFRLIWPGDSSFACLDAPETRVQATAEAKRAFDFSSDSLFARTALARAYFVNGQFEPAALILRTFAGQKDVGVNYLRDFGYSLFRLGQFREADQVFARMVRRNLLPGFAGYMRYFIASHEGRNTDAMKFLVLAVQAEPNNKEYREAFNRLASQ